VRRYTLEQDSPFSMGLADETHLSRPQVAQATVYELAGGTRRSASEVPGIYESDLQPCSRRLEGDTGANYAAPDHQHVECPRAKPL
jgi:hypothetical protein